MCALPIFWILEGDGRQLERFCTQGAQRSRQFRGLLAGTGNQRSEERRVGGRGEISVGLELRCVLFRSSGSWKAMVGSSSVSAPRARNGAANSAACSRARVI